MKTIIVRGGKGKKKEQHCDNATNLLTKESNKNFDKAS